MAGLTSHRNTEAQRQAHRWCLVCHHPLPLNVPHYLQKQGMVVTAIGDSKQQCHVPVGRGLETHVCVSQTSVELRDEKWQSLCYVKRKNLLMGGSMCSVPSDPVPSSVSAAGSLSRFVCPVVPYVSKTVTPQTTISNCSVHPEPTARTLAIHSYPFLYPF